MYCFIILFSMLYTIAYSGVLEKKHVLSKHQTQNLIHKLRLRLDELEKDAKAICGLLDGHYHYQEKVKSSGAVYTRWGRNKCPGNDTALVYSGSIAGAKYQAGKGSAANYLCIPDVPEWGKYKDGYQYLAEKIYAAEFQMETDRNAAGEATDKKFLDHDATCAICQSKVRSNVVMIPGKTKCPKGWHREYRGYLMSQHSTQSPSEFICVDAFPDIAPAGSGSQDGRLLYAVEVVCGGAIKCPQYVNGREMACAILYYALQSTCRFGSVSTIQNASRGRKTEPIRNEWEWLKGTTRLFAIFAIVFLSSLLSNIDYFVCKNETKWNSYEDR